MRIPDAMAAAASDSINNPASGAPANIERHFAAQKRLLERAGADYRAWRGLMQGNRVNWGVTNRAGSESLLILLVGKEDLGNGATSWDGRGGIRSGC
jgi:hypothetical protein